MKNLYNKLLGSSFVYDNIRPWVVGGLDNAPGYALLGAGPKDIVVDVGCGTGDALNHLSSFSSYHGFDIDAQAIETARQRAGRIGANAHFEVRQLNEDDLRRLKPTRVMLAGLLHHLSDAATLDLLRMLARTPSVRRIATIDTVYIKGEYVSNLLAFLDRGRHTRHPAGYVALVEQAGLHVVEKRLVRSHLTSGRALYFDLALEPVLSRQAPAR